MAKVLAKLINSGALWQAERLPTEEHPGETAKSRDEQSGETAKSDANESDVNKQGVEQSGETTESQTEQSKEKAPSIDFDDRSWSSPDRSVSPRRGRRAANSRKITMQATAELSPSTDTTVSPDVQRDQTAAELVNRYSAWAAAAGVIPVPFVDMIAVGGVQLKMLRELAAIYEVEFSENIGKSVTAALIGAVVPAGAAPAAAMGVVSALKFIPIVGSAIASVTMPALSAAATYAVGKVFIQHFASGGTLLDFNPQDYREFMREQARAKAAKDFPATTASPPAPTRGAAKSAS
jgi:uncharacterized protein (DUF697 family)